MHQPLSFTHGAAYYRGVVNRSSTLCLSSALPADFSVYEKVQLQRMYTAAEFLPLSFYLRAKQTRLTRSCACISRSSAQTSLLSIRFAVPSREGRCAYLLLIVAPQRRGTAITCNTPSTFSSTSPLQRQKTFSLHLRHAAVLCLCSCWAYLQ